MKKILAFFLFILFPALLGYAQTSTPTPYTFDATPVVYGSCDPYVPNTIFGNAPGGFSSGIGRGYLSGSEINYTWLYWDMSAIPLGAIVVGQPTLYCTCSAIPYHSSTVAYFYRLYSGDSGWFSGDQDNATWNYQNQSTSTPWLGGNTGTYTIMGYTWPNGGGGAPDSDFMYGDTTPLWAGSIIPDANTLNFDVTQTQQLLNGNYGVIGYPDPTCQSTNCEGFNFSAGINSTDWELKFNYVMPTSTPTPTPTSSQTSTFTPTPSKTLTSSSTVTPSSTQTNTPVSTPALTPLAPPANCPNSPSLTDVPIYTSLGYSSQSGTPPVYTLIGENGVSIDGSYNYPTFDSCVVSGGYVGSDGTFMAEILNDTTRDNNSISGIMMKGSSNPSDVNVFLGGSKYESMIYWGYRTTFAGAGTYVPVHSVTYPLYLRIVKTAGAFNGYYSEDGTNWTFAGNATLSGITSSSNMLWGVAYGGVAKYYYTNMCSCDQTCVEAATFTQTQTLTPTVPPTNTNTAIVTPSRTPTRTPTPVHTFTLTYTVPSATQTSTGSITNTPLSTSTYTPTPTYNPCVNNPTLSAVSVGVGLNSASYNSGNYYLNCNGVSGNYNSIDNGIFPDSFAFYQEAHTGDGTFVACVVNQSPNPYPTPYVIPYAGTVLGGVVIKNSPTGTKDVNMAVCVDHFGVVSSYCRLKTNGNGIEPNAKPVTPFYIWVAIKRVGNVFTTYYSTTGVFPFTQLDQETIGNASSTMYWGLISTVSTYQVVGYEWFDSVSDDNCF